MRTARYSRSRRSAQAERFRPSASAGSRSPCRRTTEGLRLLRDRAPAGMDIAAGEYGYEAFYFRRMLDAEAVDVLQADATRCGGVSGFLNVAAQCAARRCRFRPTGPVHPCAPGLCMPEVVHVEYFDDHARIERMLFDGCLEPQQGRWRPTAPARDGA